mgnify:CR=1 FL=1
MRVIEPVEVLYLSLKHRWERTAQPDRHEGELDGVPTRNTQVERLAFLLKKIALGRHSERIHSTLARHTGRNDGNSYVSKDPSWMEQPTILTDGWYFEGCTSLVQKQAILHNLGKLGFSGPFCQATEDFVANKSIKKYLPNEDDEKEVLARIQAWEEKQDNEG